jgi:hypothetical protein
MANIVFDKDKDFPSRDIGNENHKAVETLPSVVTICLASCDLCTDEYIDTTHSFRLKCLCTCGQFAYCHISSFPTYSCSITESEIAKELKVDQQSASFVSRNIVVVSVGECNT